MIGKGLWSLCDARIRRHVLLALPPSFRASPTSSQHITLTVTHRSRRDLYDSGSLTLPVRRWGANVCMAVRQFLVFSSVNSAGTQRYQFCSYWRGRRLNKLVGAQVPARSSFSWTRSVKNLIRLELAYQPFPIFTTVLGLWCGPHLVFSYFAFGEGGWWWG